MHLNVYICLLNLHTLPSRLSLNEVGRDHETPLVALLTSISLCDDVFIDMISLQVQFPIQPIWDFLE